MTRQTPPADLAASVRARLSKLAAHRGQDLQLILTRFGVERLLYRLSRVPAGKKFVLKGAVLFYVWEGEIPRPTQDVDLLGFGDSSPGAVADLFRAVCNAEVEPDGLTFLAAKVKAARIRGRQEYGGVRVRLTAMLGRARIPLQVDVGFGDAVTPKPQGVAFPTLLPFPAARIHAYPPETAVAEKFEAMVTLGIANTRMKDFYDLHHLSETHTFEGQVLAKAIRATFDRRGTAIPSDTPVALGEGFGNDVEKQAQWRGFLLRGRLKPPLELPDAIARISAFVMPVVEALRAESRFHQRWTAGGSWAASAR